MIRQSKKSLHAKLYEFTYKGNLPNNLCPYFWKIIFATIMFIPNLIIQLPHLFYILFSSEKYNFSNCGDKREFGAMIYFCLFIITVFIGINFHLIKALLNMYSYNYKVANVGFFIDFVIIVLISGHFIIKAYKNYKNNNIKEKNNSLILEFIKAKYNKYCPKIEWID